jgi:carbon monoxide dehydrogenase subunit G
MPSYEASASIAAEREAVWSVLVDVLNWPGWTPTVQKVEALDAPELKVGHRFRVHQPKLRPSVWTVTAVDAPARFTWESRVPGLVMTADHSVKATADGVSKLVLRFTLGGLLGPIVGPMNRKMVVSYMAQEAESLRKRLEAGRRAP